MHLVNPKFIAFKGPSDKREKISPGLYTLTAANYIDVFLVCPTFAADVSYIIMISLVHSAIPSENRFNSFSRIVVIVMQ